jgi:O-antigen ligase
MAAGIDLRSYLKQGEPEFLGKNRVDWELSSGFTSITNTVLFVAFIVGLAWTPLLYGSNDLLAWGINAVLFSGLAILHEFSVLVRGGHRDVAIKELAIPGALFVFVVLWIIIQNATWTPTNWHHPIWAMTSKVLQRPVQGSISVNRDLSALALLRLMTAASVFWLALQMCLDGSRAHQFVVAIVVIISAYAIYGLGMAALSLSDLSIHKFTTSTFIDRNHFAAYSGLGFVASCGLILRHYQVEALKGDGSIRFRIASFIAATGRPVVIFFIISLLALIGVLFGGSWDTIIATILGICVLGALSVQHEKKVFIKRWATILFVGGVAFIAILACGDDFGTNVADRSLADETRFAIYSITLRSILDAPLFGYGYGTFADVFPMVRDQSVNVVGALDQSHNTYLEVLQGLGLVFGSMLIASIVMLVWKCLKGAIVRRGQSVVPAIAASVAIVAGVHAFVDFSLQIQAVALMLMALLGAGVAQSIGTLRRQGE